MKRSLIAFMSLFSLVCVLSIYYVFMPGVPINGESNKDVPVTSTIQNASSVYYESLSLERENYYKNAINAQTNILISSSYNNEEKAKALQEIEYLNKNKQSELEIAKSLNSASYNYSYVEIDDSCVTVSVSLSDPKKSDIASIMAIVDAYFDENIKTIVQIHS